MNTCANCGKETKNPFFCSYACSAAVHGKERLKKRPPCLWCGKETKRMETSHCSRECQQRTREAIFLNKWKNGQDSGVRGFTGTSNFIKNYLRKTRGDRCEKCGWCEVNPVSGKVPIQLDHIDGNWKNNSENNLRLLCPNCHSLTPTFGGLNIGKGRKDRVSNLYKIREFKNSVG